MNTAINEDLKMTSASAEAADLNNRSRIAFAVKIANKGMLSKITTKLTNTELL